MQQSGKYSATKTNVCIVYYILNFYPNQYFYYNNYKYINNYINKSNKTIAILQFTDDFCCT